LWASETFQRNHPGVKVFTRDITKIRSPKSLIGNARIDGIIGGPPCQGFSLSGNRDSKDPRNSLFMDFVRFVGALTPRFFVMENVLGILSMKTKDGNHVKNIIRDEFEKIDYKLCVHVLNAADYGVPQTRQRVFFFGLRKEYPLDAAVIKPLPILSPLNYVTLKDAISDLPPVKAGEGLEEQEYPCPPKNAYQTWARAHSEKIYNHVAMRHTDRLVRRFASISYGQSVAHVSAEHAQRKRGDASVVSGKAFSQNNMRPFPDKPSPTVAASFQSNFIHPFIDRNFTAREGARIQSFPDTFVFKGKRTTMSWEKNLSQYQQIGNAVPPLLAKAIAERIKWYFSHIGSMKDDSESIGIGIQMELFK
jgi:DNA (cytosine-5)-methyltransferase 1